MKRIKLAIAIAAVLCVLAWSMAAFATDKPKEPPKQEPPSATATAEAVADAHATGGDSSSSATQSQQQANEQTSSQTIESERQAPSTFIGTAAPSAPCYYVSGWSAAVPGAGGGRTRAKRDEDCWAEYVKQAEHQREMDRERLALERDRLRLEALRLEQCNACEVRK